MPVDLVNPRSIAEIFPARYDIPFPSASNTMLSPAPAAEEVHIHYAAVDALVYELGPEKSAQEG